MLTRSVILLSLIFIFPIVVLSQSLDDENYTSFRVRIYQNSPENQTLFQGENNLGLVSFLEKNVTKSTLFKGISFSGYRATAFETELKKNATLKVACTQTLQKDLYGDVRLNAKGESISITSCDSIYYLFPKEQVEWQVTEKLVSLKDDWELDKISLFYWYKKADKFVKTCVFSMEREDYIALIKNGNRNDYFAATNLKSQVICKEIDRFTNLNSFASALFKEPCTSVRFEVLEKEQLGFLKKANESQSLISFLNTQLKTNNNLLFSEMSDLQSVNYNYLSTIQNEIAFKEAIGYYWIPEGETYADYTSTIAIREATGGGGDFTRKMIYHPAKLSELIEIRIKKEYLWDAETNAYRFQTVAFCPIFEHTFDEITLQTRYFWYSAEKTKKSIPETPPYWFNLLESKTVQGLIFGEYNCQK